MSEREGKPPEPIDRRGFITAAAVAGVAATGLTAGQAAAQAGALPLDAPMSKIFSPPEYRMLTPNAQKLTKGELLQLQQWARSHTGPAPLHLTMADIHSIQIAHDHWAGRRQSGTVTAEDVTACCCCCPCCTCTAAVSVHPVVKTVHVS